ncbi:hypothetical protein DSM25558_4508 [Agrobacterium sp. DSM 25558]|nr:hypothetical protein DSM25558_4508 [Agrobacterium sp. DSM 25558]
MSESLRMDPVWRVHHFIWKKPDSWMPSLETWLASRFRKDGMRRLRRGDYRDICWDDPEWSEILGVSLRGGFDSCTEALANALEYSVMRTFPRLPDN